MIYTDNCDKELEERIYSELNLKVLKRIEEDTWNINDALLIVTEPHIKLAVINNIDEVSIMEISLLSFLCRPILVTAKAIKEYPVLSRTVNHIDENCNLKDSKSNFITWYKYTYLRRHDEDSN
jgi:hypothetical protein